MALAKSENLAATIIAGIILGSFLVVTFYVVPSFERLLAEAEFNLPPITKFAIDSSLYWNIFGIIAVTGCILVSRLKKKVGWFLIVSAGMALLSTIPFLIHAMYEPIFQL